MSDCEKVYGLICDMENTGLHYDKFSAIFQEQINDMRYYCLICEQGHAVVGVLHVRFEQQLHHAERIAEIMEFVVDPSYRHQGIGKRMLEYACQIAKVACNQLRLDTHRFYLREGMHNFHFKFSKSLIGEDTVENTIGTYIPVCRAVNEN